MARISALLFLRDIPRDQKGKPILLREVLGLPLIERLFLALKRSGINNIIIIGDVSEDVEKAIIEISRKRELCTALIGNGDINRIVNTLSKSSSERFLIILKPYLILERELRRIIDEYYKNGGKLLVVIRGDGSISPKVSNQHREISEGILLQMARNVVATIVPRENIINLPRSLNLSKATSLELLRAIINDQKSHITIIRRGVFSISSTRELRKLENYLLASLRKPDDGFISYYINRRISARISKFLVKTSLTPNMISIISFAMAAVAAYFFSIGNYLMSIIAGILTQIASIIDGCDGEVARLKGLSSKYGALFDTLLDRYADILLVIGIGYGYYLMTQNSLSLLLLAIPLTGFIMSSYARKEYMIRYEKQPKGKLLLLIRRDFRLFGIFIGALIGMAYHAIITIGALSHIIIIIHYIIGQRRKE